MADEKSVQQKNTGKLSFGTRFVNFFKHLPANIARPFRDMFYELKKVTWPSKKDLINYTLLVLAFIVHHLYDYIAEKPNFSFVTTGAVEHTIGAKALIVRDEDIIVASSGGELVTQITEGSRVAKGQELAIVVPEEMKSTVTDLRNVQSQISDVQQELILAGNVAEADVIYRNYNKNLSVILDSVRFDAMSGNLNNMSSYGSSVNVILDEREPYRLR